MQFTYERAGNNCWLIDKLIFDENTVIHYSTETNYVEVKDLISCLKLKQLTINNFSGLEDYLKKNYSEVLPEQQFTYEREGNDCWLTDTLNFIGKQVLCTVDVKSSRRNFNETTNIKVTSLLSYLKEECLTLDNFPGLEDYLKEYYSEVLPKLPITERELISQLVEMLDHFIEGDDNIDFDAYKKAMLYLDPSYDESEDFLV